MKTKQLALIATAMFSFTAGSHAAVLASYDFTTGVTAQTIAASSADADVMAGNFSAVGTYSTNVGISSAGNAYLRSTTTASSQANALTALASGSNDYFQVTISADPGMTLNLTSLTFGMSAQNNNSGGNFTSTAVLSSNVNGFGTAILGTGGITKTAAQSTSTVYTPLASYDLSGAQYQGLSTITFRLTVFDSINDNGDLSRFDDFTLNGAVVPEPSSALLGGLGILLILRRRR